MSTAIGIDPDSKGFVCALVGEEKAQTITRRFSVSQEGLRDFLGWVSAQGRPLVGIEGTHGQSRPLEKVLRESGVIFHSFKPADTERFRKAVLGQNKNNERDAESVARYSLALEAQGKLEQYRRVWDADMELQLLTRRYEIIGELIAELQEGAVRFPSISAGIALVIRHSAQQIQYFKGEQSELVRILESLTEGNLAVQCLKGRRGIATLTAAKMIAEIIDIRRFPREDSLACYTGLGMREHSTGNTAMMVPTRLFNHRLKDAFMTAARNVVLYDGDSHLAGYQRNLVKAGMRPLEATKRVARALVRVIFRELSALNESKAKDEAQEGSKEGEGDMASGVTRGDQGRQSNMSPSSRRVSKSKSTRKVKSSQSQAAKTSGGRKKVAITKKTS